MKATLIQEVTLFMLSAGVMFFEAKDYSPVECERVLAMIAKLFSIEKEKDDLLLTRRTQSLPIVDELFEYLNQLWFEHVVDKTSMLGKAISYTVKREKELRQFLIHENIQLSNNYVERVIRPVALGRKNWMFCWSEVGAKYAAIAYILIQCCKLHGINPWEYLVHVLHRIDTHPAREVHLLTPKNWKVQNFQK